MTKSALHPSGSVDEGTVTLLDEKSWVLPAAFCLIDVAFHFLNGIEHLASLVGVQSILVFFLVEPTFLALGCYVVASGWRTRRAYSGRSRWFRRFLLGGTVLLTGFNLLFLLLGLLIKLGLGRS